MPELGEVEYCRKRWDVGLAQRVSRVHLQDGKRVFRGADTSAIRSNLEGATFLASEARGKQILFRFSGGSWMTLHLGMSGRLRVEPPDFTPGKHDHLVLIQAGQALVFADPRLFGRVQFHRGRRPPAWWGRLPPAVTGSEFTLARMGRFLQRHGRLSIKGALLLQAGFPGIGNWMADEVLWRAGIDPRTPAGALDDERLERLWRVVRWVSRRALTLLGERASNLPVGWLFHERWSPGGRCPRHRALLSRAVVGGRTTAWCGECQR